MQDLLPLWIHLYRHEVVLLDHAARRRKRASPEPHELLWGDDKASFFSHLFHRPTRKPLSPAIFLFDDPGHKLCDK